MWTAIQLISRSMAGVPRSGNCAHRGACETSFTAVMLFSSKIDIAFKQVEAIS